MYLQRLNASMAAYENTRSRSISLVAGQNIFGVEVSALISSDLGNRVVENIGEMQIFPGMGDYLDIETLGRDICREHLGAEATELRPVTGTIANIITYQSLLRPGDLVASLSVVDGSHVSASARTLKHFGYKHVNLPFSSATLTLDTDHAISVIRQSRPSLIVLGGSVALFHETIEPISVVSKEIGAILMYDAAHTIGLILSGHAPNPLACGCDILNFTTCKTLPGPQHALICGRDDLLRKIGRVSEIWYSGYHLHEVAAAVYALSEAVSSGPFYGEAMVLNAQRLAAALDRSGVPILRNNQGQATNTYMLLADVRTYGGGKSCEQRLAEVGIYVNSNYLPGFPSQVSINPHGLRLGVAEVTRLGMKPTHMDLLAEIIGSALTSDGRRCAEQVMELREAFPFRRMRNENL